MKKFFVISIVFLLFGGLMIILFSQRISAQIDSSQEEKQNNELGKTLTPSKDWQYSLDHNTQLVTFLKALNQSLPIDYQAIKQLDTVSVASQFLQEYGHYFGLNDPVEELKFIKEGKDELGMSHLRYNQKHLGVPVFGGQMIVHLNNDLSVYAANGKVLTDINLDPRPKISSEEAIQIAKELWQKQFGLNDAQVLKTNIYIINKGLIQNKPDKKNYLVWQIELFNEAPQTHEYYFIDAQTGELVYQITGIQQAVHRHIWDCSYGDGDCYLDAYDWITDYTYGRSEGQAARGTNPNPYIASYAPLDTDNVYTVTGELYNYYLEKFSRNGANNYGGTGDGSALFPENTISVLTYINYHFLDENDYASCPNAFFNAANSLHFCRGWIQTDIVGHEYAHAVNYFSILDGSGNPAGLTYTYESGALNEANSDIFGEALEYYIDGNSDWLVSEDHVADPNYIGIDSDGPFRDMANPATIDSSLTGNPYPTKFNDENYYCDDDDNGGVHHNSSVPNHAAYLMAMGGTFNGCEIEGIGRTKEEAIFYRAETVYYTTSTTFNEAYDTLLAACNDLYDSSDCQQVEKALRATEMNQGGKCSGEEAVDPNCEAVENPPTINSVSSDKDNGIYQADEVIDIDVTFSEAVTSTGEVAVTLETGDTDRTCNFTITNSLTGSCNYTVQDDDTSGDLDVSEISGTIADAYGDVLTNFTPATNLADNKALIIDTVGPTVTLTTDPASPDGSNEYFQTAPVVSLSAEDSPSGVSSISYSTDGSDYTTYEDSLTLDNTTTLYYYATDLAGNQSETVEQTIKVDTDNPILDLASLPAKTTQSAITLTGNASDDGSGLDRVTINSDSVTVDQEGNFSQDVSLDIGSNVIAVRATDNAGNNSAVDLTVRRTGGYLLITPETGKAPLKVYNTDLELQATFFPYGANFDKGYKAVIADLEGDGDPEIVTAPNQGGSPQVVVFNLQGTQLRNQIMAYASGFRGGVVLAAGDVDNDSKDEIVTLPASAGGSNCRIFGWRNGQLQATTVNFFIFPETLRGGFSLAMPDMEPDGKAEIVVAPRSGGSAHLQVFGYRASERRYRAVILGLKVYAESFRGGITLAGGDVDGDSDEEIITGTYSGGGPHVTIVYRKTNGTLAKMNPGFLAFHPDFRGGVNVGNFDYHDRGKGAIVVAPRTSAEPQVKFYDQAGTLLGSFYPYARDFLTGVNVN